MGKEWLGGKTLPEAIDHAKNDLSAVIRREATRRSATTTRRDRVMATDWERRGWATNDPPNDDALDVDADERRDGAFQNGYSEAIIDMARRLGLSHADALGAAQAGQMERYADADAARRRAVNAERARGETLKDRAPEAS